MQRSYTLPVSAILQTLRDQNGITALSASLPSVPGYQQEPGEAVLIIGQGHVQTCMIRARDGHQLAQGGEALKALEQIGNLEWQVQGFRGSGEAGQTISSNGQAPAWSQEDHADQYVPRRRVAALSLTQQQALSHRQRQVFALADGVRSIASIATLLRLSSEDVARLLRELHHDQLLD